MSNETRSYRDEIPNPACPVHRQHCRHQRYAAPSPAPLSYCLPWQRSPSQQSCTSHDQDDQQLRRVPQPRGSASAPIPGDGSCRPFPTQVCCLAHTHTAVRVCGVHHGPAASCPSPGCNLRHGTAAQPSPSTRVEPAHECDGGAETACTGQGWDVPAVSTGWVNAPGCAQTPARLSRARGACCGSLGTGDICSGPQQGAPRWGQQGAKLEGKQTKWRAAV